jgi:hypothetical protein
MAQTGNTPISLYYSATTGNTPTAGNLGNGELAINTADGILFYKNPAGTVVPLSSSGGNLSWQAVQTSNFTASAGNGYYVNTTSAAITVTLPASPTAGQSIALVDFAGTFATNNLIINPNGNKFLGATANKKLTTNREAIAIVYVDATQGWLIFDGFNASIPAPTTISATYLVVAGGGGGGQGYSGGAGAGGLLTGTASLTPGSVYTVTVGGGGTGGSSVNGGNGSNSVLSGSGITTVTSIGGGGGSGGNQNGASGGSGGGGGGPNGTPGSGTAGQGNSGGTISGTQNAPGGGGAGAAGGNSSGTTSGNGGVGIASSITGSSVYYAGGGGGGGYQPFGNPAGTGGNGGGGDGGYPNGSAGSAGGTNTGGGGGGGSGNGGYGGVGGSGVVILSVPTSSYSGTTTGSPTVTTSGGNTIIKFTASGSYTA